MWVKEPGQEAGRTSARRVSGLDVLPTIADVIGLSPPWEGEGQSMVGAAFAPVVVLLGLGEAGHQEPGGEPGSEPGCCCEGGHENVPCVSTCRAVAFSWRRRRCFRIRAAASRLTPWCAADPWSVRR